MERNKFDDLNVMEQLDFINKQLKQDGSLTQICKNISIARSTLRKRFNKLKYRYSKENNQYIKNDDNSMNSVIINKKINDSNKTSVINKHMQEKKNTNDRNQTLVINNNLKENIIDLAKNHEDIIQMLDWFKNNDKSMTNVIEVIEQGLTINLPKETVTDYRTTIRVNNIIWDQFKQFVKKYPEYKMKDLLSQALLEFIRKYSKER